LTNLITPLIIKVSYDQAVDGKRETRGRVYIELLKGLKKRGIELISLTKKGADT